MQKTYKAVSVCGAMLLWCRPVCADDLASRPAPSWPDTFVTRVEAVALLQTLNVNLLSHDSATATLERWCEIHRLASPPHIVAVRDPDSEKPVASEQRRELGVTPAEPVRYRRVKLLCGTVLLSEADNWYVPGRLTAEMNKLLDGTDMPFGKVVQGLHFRRRTLSSALLWIPLPEGWEMNPIPPSAAPGVLTIPPLLLQHRALLTLPDGTPLSEVVETYTAGVLAFRAPAP